MSEDDKKFPEELPKKPADLTNSEDELNSFIKTQNPSDLIAFEKHTEEIENSRSNRAMRETYAKRVYTIAWMWLLGVYLIILFDGFRVHLITNVPFDLYGSYFSSTPFHLHDTVMVSILGATGAIGLLAIVLKYLFPSEKKKES